MSDNICKEMLASEFVVNSPGRKKSVAFNDFARVGNLKGCALHWPNLQK